MTDLWELRTGDVVCRRPRFADDPEALVEGEVVGFTVMGLVVLRIPKGWGFSMETLEFPENLDLQRTPGMVDVTFPLEPA